MKKQIMSVVSAVCIIACFDSAQAVTVTTNEELEQYTTTKVNEYLTRYHLTTAENIENGYKGGEGYQLTMAMAISDANPKSMIRGDDTSGTHVSYDGGETWKMSDTRLIGVVTGLAFYPGSDKIAFAVVEGAKTRAGVYKSTDGGNTWDRVQYIPNSSKHMTYTKIGFGKKDEKTGKCPGYVISTGFTAPDGYSYGTEDVQMRGVYKSTDGGDTWVQLDEFKNGLPLALWIDDSSDTVIVCTRDRGISVSYDGGATWTQKNNGWLKIGATAIAVDPYDKNHWVAIATNSNPVTEEYPDGNPYAYIRYPHYTNGEQHSNKFDILYETNDGGENWSLLDATFEGGLINGVNPKMIGFSYQQSNDKKYTYLYISFDESVYPTRVSKDGGKTFVKIDVDDTNSIQNPRGWYSDQLCFTKDVTMTSGQGCGVTLYDDESGQFKMKNSGISGGLGMTYYFDKDGKLQFVGLMDVGIMQAGKYAKYDGYDWYNGDFPLIREAPDFAWGTGGRSSGFVTQDPNDENHFFTVAGAAPYGGNSAIIETINGFENSIIHQGIYDLMESERDAGTASRNSAYVEYGGDNLIYSTWFVSEDNGKNWRETKYAINDVGNQNGDICYAISKNRLMISTDRAKTWTNTGFSFSDVRRRAVVDVNDDYVVWVPNHGNSTLYRVDLRNKTVQTFGPENGLVSPNERACKTLQITSFAQNPRDSNHIIVTGTDYYDNSAGYNFESFDGGNTFEYIDVPGTSMVFHPTKSLVYLGGASGTWVYNYEIRKNMNK